MDKETFISTFDKLAEDILADVKQTGMTEEAVAWVKKSLYYNVPGGKLNRGLSVVDTLKIIRGDKITEDEIFKAAVLGWCIEFLQAFFLVSDDLMDSSITRRGQPCWYRIPGVKYIAVNDAFILESVIYRLLRKYFKTETTMSNLLKFFMRWDFESARSTYLLQTTWQTEMGQLVDLLTAPEDHVDLSKFNVDKQKFISKYKTAYYSFYLPVASALYMVGISDEVSHQKTKDILIPIGEYFQIQDDFLDCFGDPEFIGKVGTDIEDNKCSWLIGTALAKVTPEQRKMLDSNYGQKDSEKVATVKKLYNELDLKSDYESYEEATYKKLTQLISELDANVLKPEIFTTFLNKIYKRTK